MIDFFSNHPFVFGLFVGLLVAGGVWVRSLFLARGREREITRLKELLHTKLEIEARAHKALHDELESLRKHNENLRVTVKGLQQKPDRADLRTLQVYDQAIRALLARSPGFGPAWQSVLDEAEQRMSETETGVTAFVRRVLSPRTLRALPEKGSDDGDEPSRG